MITNELRHHLPKLNLLDSRPYNREGETLPIQICVHQLVTVFHLGNHRLKGPLQKYEHLLLLLSDLRGLLLGHLPSSVLAEIKGENNGLEPGQPLVHVIQLLPDRQETPIKSDHRRPLRGRGHAQLRHLLLRHLDYLIFYLLIVLHVLKEGPNGRRIRFRLAPPYDLAIVLHLMESVVRIFG